MTSLFEPPPDRQLEDRSGMPMRGLYGLGAGVLVGACAALILHVYVWLQWARGQNVLESLGFGFAGAIVACCFWFFVSYLSRRRARLGVTLWLAAAAAFWFISERLLNLEPAAADEFVDPRVYAALGTIVGAGAFCVFALVSFIDWLIAHNEHKEIEQRHG